MGKIINLDKQDLISKYPQYEGRKNVDLQSWTMFPIGIKSQHHGKQVTFTKKGAQSIINNMKDMPVMYVDGEYIPTTHKDSAGNRKVVGTTIGGGIYTDDSGIEWAYADALIYTNTETEIYDTIINNQDKLATSIEAEISVDEEFNIHDANYEGLSILSNEASAWDTKLLVADKGDVQVTYDDAIKQVIGDDYATKLNARDTELEGLKTQIETLKTNYESKLTEKEEKINGLNDENTSLRKLNTKFSDLIK